MDEEAADELVGKSSVIGFCWPPRRIILPLEANLAYPRYQGMRLLEIWRRGVYSGRHTPRPAPVRRTGALHRPPIRPDGPGPGNAGRHPAPSSEPRRRKNANWTGGKRPLQRFSKKPPEQLRENLHRQEIARPARDPSVAIRPRSPPPGTTTWRRCADGAPATNWTPTCGERRRSRSPHQDASGRRRSSAKSRRDRAEQNAVDDGLVLQGNGRQLGRQGEHQRGSIVCQESRHGGHPATERGPVIGTSGSAGFGN